MPEYTTTTLESQLDWLTASTHSDRGMLELQNIASSLAEDEMRMQNKLGPFRLMGYVGWRVGRVRYGTRDHGGIIQLSGQLAEDWAKTVLAATDHVTRTDLAVTVRFDPPQPNYGELAWQAFARNYSNKPRSAMPWSVFDAAGGRTVYLGNRRSPLHFRLYNKEAEALAEGDRAQAERYRAAWRFELECHDAAASAVAMAAVGSSPRAAHIGGTVYEYLQQHGLDAPFTANANPMLPGGFRRRSDYQTRIGWFRRSVAPSVRWAVEHGERSEVLDALGLTEDSNQTHT